MEAAPEITKEIEARAAALGASAWTIAKWRARGIPARWQIKLFGLNDERAELSGAPESQAGEAAE